MQISSFRPAGLLPAIFPGDSRGCLPAHKRVLWGGSPAGHLKGKEAAMTSKSKTAKTRTIPLGRRNRSATKPKKALGCGYFDCKGCDQCRSVPSGVTEGLTRLNVTTRHPQDYVLHNEADGTRWRGTTEGRWVRDGVPGTWEHQCTKRPASAPKSVYPVGEACPKCGAADGVTGPRGETLPPADASASSSEGKGVGNG